MVTSSQRNDKRLHSVQLWEICDTISLCKQNLWQYCRSVKVEGRLRNPVLYLEGTVSNTSHRVVYSHARVINILRYVFLHSYVMNTQLWTTCFRNVQIKSLHCISSFVSEYQPEYKCLISCTIIFVFQLLDENSQLIQVNRCTYMCLF